MLTPERTRTFADLVAEVKNETLSGQAADILTRGIVEYTTLLDDQFEAVTRSWEWREDIHAIEGLGVASAFIGKHFVGSEEIAENARQLLRNFRTPEQLAGLKAMPAGQGFAELFQLTKGLKPEQYELVELLAAQELIANSKAALHESAEDIDILLIANSIPTTPDFADHLKAFMGLPDHCLIYVYHRACDSSGSALYDLMHGDYDADLQAALASFKEGRPAKVTILADETAANKYDMGSDDISPQLFSAAMSALSLHYHPWGKSTFRFVAGDSLDVEEGAECLRYIAPYDNWPEYRQRPNVHFAPYLSTPESPTDVVFMDPLETGRYFKDNDLVLINQAMNKLIPQLGLPLETVEKLQQEADTTKKSAVYVTAVTEKIKRLVIHHPSPAVFNNLKRKLVNFYGFTDEQIQWVINEGNAPAATVLIAMGRQLADFETGDLIMVNSFGAGGSFHCGFYEYLLKPSEKPATDS